MNYRTLHPSVRQKVKRESGACGTHVEARDACYEILLRASAVVDFCEYSIELSASITGKKLLNEVFRVVMPFGSCLQDHCITSQRTSVGTFAFVKASDLTVSRTVASCATIKYSHDLAARGRSQHKDGTSQKTRLFFFLVRWQRWDSSAAVR
jgi:hypothetical protein